MIPGRCPGDLLAGLFNLDPPELRGFTVTQGKKDTDMGTHDTVEEIRARADRARLEADRLERTAAQLEQWGEEDPFVTDDVLVFTRLFRGRMASYTYVALRTDAGWYITGRGSAATTNGVSWQTLVGEHLRRADEVWRVTEYEAVHDAG